MAHFLTGPLPRDILVVRRQVHSWLLDPVVSERFLGLVRFYSNHLNCNRVMGRVADFIAYLCSNVRKNVPSGALRPYHQHELTEMETMVKNTHDIIAERRQVSSKYRILLPGLMSWPPTFVYGSKFYLMVADDRGKFFTGPGANVLRYITPQTFLETFGDRGNWLLGDYWTYGDPEGEVGAEFADILQEGHDFGYEAPFFLCATYELFRAKPLSQETCSWLPAGTDEQRTERARQVENKKLASGHSAFRTALDATTKLLKLAAPRVPAAQPVPPPDGKVVKASHNVAAKRANHTSIELRGDPSRYVPPPDDSRRVISTVGAGEMVWVIYESVTPSDVVAYWKETERQLGELRAKVEAHSGNPHVDPFPYYVGRDALQLLEAILREREAAASGEFDKQTCYTFLQAYMARLKALTDELSFCLEAWATPRPARQHVVEFSGASGVFALDALGKRLGQLVDDYQNGMARYIAKTANPGPSGLQGGLRKVYSCPYNEDLWRVADAVAWPARADLSKIQAELELDLQLLKQPTEKFNEQHAAVPNTGGTKAASMPATSPQVAGSPSPSTGSQAPTTTSAVQRDAIKPATPSGCEVAWDYSSEAFIPGKKAIELSSGKLTYDKLNDLLKPNGQVRYMRKGHRCKVHVQDLLKALASGRGKDGFTEEAAAMFSRYQEEFAKKHGRK